MDALENAAAIHHVGLNINDRAFKQSVCKQVSSPDVVTIPDTNSCGAMVNEGRQLRCAHHAFSEGLRGCFFLREGAIEQLDQHFESLIFVFQLLAAPSTREEKMEVIFIHKRWVRRITPPFGIEMQAQNEIGLDLSIHDFGTLANFAGSVKKPLALAFDGLTRGFFAFFPKRCGSGLTKLGWTHPRDRFGMGACEVNLRSHGLKPGNEKLGDLQRHVPLNNGFGFSDLEPALLDFRPLAADMPGINRDLHPAQRPRCHWLDLAAPTPILGHRTR